MKRATLPPTLASRLQARFTRNTQMQPLRRYAILAASRSACWDQLAVVVDDALVLVDGFTAKTPKPWSFDRRGGSSGRYIGRGMSPHGAPGARGCIMQRTADGSATSVMEFGRTGNAGEFGSRATRDSGTVRASADVRPRGRHGAVRGRCSRARVCAAASVAVMATTCDAHGSRSSDVPRSHAQSSVQRRGQGRRPDLRRRARSRRRATSARRRKACSRA